MSWLGSRFVSLVPALVLCGGLAVAGEKVPIVYSTDLFHPHTDPDDHYDLACLFAIAEFDIRGIILDLGGTQAKQPGRPAVEQMLHAAGRKVYQRGPEDFVALRPERRSTLSGSCRCARLWRAATGACGLKCSRRSPTALSSARPTRGTSGSWRRV
jgi:hypothetical protein